MVSDYPVKIAGQKTVKVRSLNPEKYIGKRIPTQYLKMSDYTPKELKDLKVAFICNWNDQCGISTYSKFLVDAIQPIVKEIKVFSEHSDSIKDSFVEECWQRGESLLGLAKKIKSWGADFIIIQHEFGIFPNAFYFMQLMEKLQDIPYVVTIHSVYQHLDKVVYTECIKNAVVHSDAAKKCLENNGNRINTYVIPHGCFKNEDSQELWNIMLSPYTVLQFGFGFRYKGVENAIKAINHLTKNDAKFKDIRYIYLCSENRYNSSVHDSYYEDLQKLCKELDVENNVVIIRKYQTDHMLNLYLRLAKVAIFPYVVDKDNIVFGASGAIRVAMANNKPVIASSSTMFEDLEGVVPRPSSYLELASEIDKIFSDEQYKNQLLEKSKNYVEQYDWSIVAKMYLDIYNQLTSPEKLAS